MSELQNLKDSMDALGYAFHEFKATNDQRLEQIEAHKAVDPLLLEKMHRLNTSLDRAQDDINRLTISSQRPILEKISCTDEHTIAFQDYMRKGQTRLLKLFEKQNLNNSQSGFVIPKPILDKINTTLTEESSIRRLSRITQITTSALEMLVPTQDAQAVWAEGTTRPETPGHKLEKITISLYELYSSQRVTQKFLDDTSVSLEQWLSDEMTKIMSSAENNAFLTGDGLNKPKGILKYDLCDIKDKETNKISSVTTGVDGDFQENNPEENLIDLFHALKPAYMSRAVWLMSSSALAKVRKLKDPNSHHYLWQPSFIAGTMPTLMGHPIHLMDAMESLKPGTASRSIIFGNFYEGFHIVENPTAHLLRDPYTYKPYVEFYFTRRVGGCVVNCEAFKIMNFKVNRS